jgi:septal ring factor EnvC (AmiA/AmiB activator)
MLNSMFPHGLSFRRGERKPVVATAFLVALLSLCVGPGAAFGQDQPEAPPQSGQQSNQGMGRHMGHRQMPSVDDQLKHLSTKLSLSDDQQAKLKPILEDQRKQMEQIHADASLSREDRFSKMQELRQNADTQIKSVLNEDQQKNFDKMREEQRDRMGKWRKGGDNAPPSGGAPQ